MPVFHPLECMCDACIKQRVIDNRTAKEIEARSQEYIKRRGGVDPRSTRETEAK